jgi:hypothetical protein
MVTTDGGIQRTDGGASTAFRNDYKNTCQTFKTVPPQDSEMISSTETTVKASL